MVNSRTMKTIILYFVKKWLTPEKVAKLIAGIIANLLRKASKSNNWDTIKAIIEKVESACHVFNEVYADETLTKDEEEQIASSIENMTGISSIHSVISKVDSMM